MNQCTKAIIERKINSVFYCIFFQDIFFSFGINNLYSSRKLNPRSGTFSKCPQMYIKLTGFEDNDSWKLPFKYYLLRLCSFWEMSKNKSQNNFRLRKTKVILACKTQLISYDIIPKPYHTWLTRFYMLSSITETKICSFISQNYSTSVSTISRDAL